MGVSWLSRSGEKKRLKNWKESQSRRTGNVFAASGSGKILKLAPASANFFSGSGFEVPAFHSEILVNPATKLSFVPGNTKRQGRLTQVVSVPAGGGCLGRTASQ